MEIITLVSVNLLDYCNRLSIDRWTISGWYIKKKQKPVFTLKPDSPFNISKQLLKVVFDEKMLIN